MLAKLCYTPKVRSSIGSSLVLASTSPRRSELLQNAGFRFTVEPPGEGVEPHFGKAQSLSEICELAEQSALAKAMSVRPRLLSQRADASSLIIGADTVVVHNDHVLGKPADQDEALSMLIELSGQWHKVVTGLAVVRLGDGQQSITSVVTKVLFQSLTDQEVVGYVSTGEPMDKAGAYGIQGAGGLFVECIEGCYFNVVGLPMNALYQLLKKYGWYLC